MNQSPTTASTPEPRLPWGVVGGITATFFTVNKRKRFIKITQEESKDFSASYCGGVIPFPIGTRATLEQAKQIAEEYYEFLTK